MLAQNEKKLNKVFLLGTSVVWGMGWAITLAGLAATQHKFGNIGISSLSWFRLIFSLLLNGVFFCLQYCKGTRCHYSTILVGQILDFVWLVQIATSIIFTLGPAELAALFSGLIISGVVQAMWLLALSTTPDTTMGCYFYCGKCKAGACAGEKKQCGSAPHSPGPKSTDLESGANNIPPSTPAKDDSLPVIASNGQTKARVLYNYEKNDPRELSLKAGETIEVVSSQGNWWLCRRKNESGAPEEGHAPSNYLQKL